MSERKAEKDYSAELDGEIPAIEKLSLTQFDEAFNKLLVYEKKARQAGDQKSSCRVLVAIAKMLSPENGKDETWQELNEQVLLLVKKHGQSRAAIQALVNEVIERLPMAPSLDLRLQTINTLRTVTEGRIFLELERAKVTQILARVEVEQHDDYSKAAELMGELQVETFGSMEMPEKIDFILEQVELYVKSKDFVHATIASRKILPRYFAKAGEDSRTRAQKIRFYELKVLISLSSNDYLNVCQNLRHIYDTPPAEDAMADESDEEATANKHKILGEMVLFAVLAPHNNLQSDVLHHLARESDLSLLPLFDQLVQMFTTSELIRWPRMVDVYGERIRAQPEMNDHRWEDLRQRVIEHNIRVVAKFYTRITIAGLAELLDLNATETEETLAKLVGSGMVTARIDRPKRIISFVPVQNNEDVLNEWSNNTARLLEHVETLCHLISKEEMLYGVKA